MKRLKFLAKKGFVPKGHIGLFEDAESQKLINAGYAEEIKPDEKPKSKLFTKGDK